ncbi:D-inositol-3-phosphate glycosyltransferase [Mycobacterium kansasii]|uniref:D-inositol-3-phosphate glycosyltransferase n=1 Tax=Mycobacterium kansasii TaxID=1768 RepID=UPI0015E21A6A|nr:D-inositol-3-phosphate glycosyltransferase [Mycobacterium kansasii]
MRHSDSPRLAGDEDPRRVALLAVHTSPLAQPGTGDAGGMNVYVLQSALHLGRRGIEVEIFTRATASTDPPVVQVAPGVLVRNVVAGPFEGLDKYDLPTQLCAFAAGVLRAEAAHEPGYYDIVHSHYWLSGQVGWLARDRWAVPLVHTAHTLAAVKNAALADGDAPEPPLRIVGEQQVVDEADRLIVNTEDEARQLISIHHADPARVDVVHPGVDLDVFSPGDRRAARAALGLPLDGQVVAFVGRIQPLKAPDIVLRAVAKLPGVRVVVAGGPSGSGLAAPEGLARLAGELGIAHRVTFLPPQSRTDLATVFHAADLVAVPSYSESFGLVAIEAQACGTPVVAAAVGGLPVAVRDGITGTLVSGHDVDRWADAIEQLLRRNAGTPGWAMSRAAAQHAAGFSWDHTTDALLASYRRAIGDFTAGRRRRVRDLVAARKPRRWTARRGVGA